MGLPTLFKIPPHKIFEFKARYYDPVKEEFDQRVERAKRDAGASSAINEKGEYVPAVKGQMRCYINRTYASTQRRNSNFRMIIIAAVLAFIAYYILHS